MPFELWDKRVPKGAAKKDFLKILLICDFNIAGHYTYLMQAINKYSPYRARCIIWHDDHFKFGKDIILDDLKGGSYEEPAQLAHEADFYIFGRYIFNFPGVDFAEENLVGKDNAFIQYHGSFLRDNGPQLRQYHLENDVFAVSGCDWTSTGRLAGCIYHIDPYLCDFSDMDIKDIPTMASPTDTLIINAGAAKNPLKGYDFLETTVKRLKVEGYKIELRLFTDLPHDKFIEEKRKCHITFASLHGGGFGLTGVESMWMAQPVLFGVTPWLLSLYPDVPFFPIDYENLGQTLISLLQNPDDVKALGLESREWVQRHFSTKTTLLRYLYLIDLIRDRDGYMGGDLKVPRIYDF